jgi:plastocyanin
VAVLIARLVEALRAGAATDRGARSAEEVGHPISPQDRSPGRIHSTETLILGANPASASVGQPVRVIAKRSSVGPSAWPLGGDGAHALDAGDVPVARMVFRRPAEHLVPVRVGQGGRRLHAAGPISIEPVDRRTRAGLKTNVRRNARSPTSAATENRPSARGPTALIPRGSRAAHPVVTIADFTFPPSSITVQVGDTVAWTNEGPSAHTPTAQDGSFNTGVLGKGASASHTFTTAGTFTYICQIHPFTHGTIVVLGRDGPLPDRPRHVRSWTSKRHRHLVLVTQGGDP